MSKDKRYRNEEVLHRLYHEEKMTMAEIADELDTTTPTLRRWMDKHEIQRRDPSDRVMNPKHSKEENQYSDEEKLRELYIEQEMSIEEISDELDCGATTVRSWMKKFGITFRKRRKQNSEENYINGKRNYKHKNLMKDLYVNQNLSARQISNKLDCSMKSVYKWLDKHKIKTRNRDEVGEMLRVEKASFFTLSNGYEAWSVYTEGEPKIIRVHQLLAISKGRSPHKVFSNGLHEVHHRNEIPWDNRPSNIELLTQEEHRSRHSKDGKQ